MQIKPISKLFKRSGRVNCSAVVLASGKSERFGGDKIFAKLSDTPIIIHSLLAFEACDYISEIIVVSAADRLMEMAELCQSYGISKISKVICGGETRLESSLCGVSEIDPQATLVAIHDGARPLVTKRLIEDVIECAIKHKAAVPAISTMDTVKVITKGTVEHTPDRDTVYGIQTPQVFIPEIIKGALTNALLKELTVYDDASAVEALKFPVHISRGCEENMKITRPIDIKFAEIIIKSREEQVNPLPLQGVR